MPSATLTLEWQQGGETLSQEMTIVSSGNGQAAWEGNYSLTSAQANVEAAFAADKDLIIGFFVSSDKDLLIETNSSSAPDDTITVVGGEGYAWASGMDHTTPFSADITKFFLTNGEAATATVKIRIILDGTP